MTLKNFLKELSMNANVLTISILIGVLALIGALSFQSNATLKSMERNIETAINKGIDPLAVRCAYKNSSDNVCVAYAVTVKK